MTLPIPLEALEDAGIVLGRRGAGKSNALMCLFEHELDDGHRAVMIDPKGDRFGIRMNPDGSPSRFDIPIFGGAHGDLPLEVWQGERMGRLVAEHNLSCLIDLSQMSLGEKQKFMMGFAPELLHRNRAALTLFIEEVDQFANQDPRYQPPMLVHHIANFSTLGRQRGIVPWVASQRPAKVNATVRSQADTFVGMKVTNPLDRKAFMDWFEGHSPEAAALVKKGVGSLDPGEAMVWVGATEFFDRVKFPMASTFDSGRTPKHGETIAAVTLAPIDLGEIRAALGEEEVAATKPAQNIPGNIPDVELSAKIGRLEARIAELEAEREEWTIERAGGQQQLEELQRDLDHWRTRAEARGLLLQRAREALQEDAELLAEAEKLATEIWKKPPVDSPNPGGTDVTRSAARAEPIETGRRRDHSDATGRRPDNAAQANGKLGPERRPLATLAGVYPSGMTEAQWATAAGFKRTSGTWSTYKGRLRTAGLIERQGDLWLATESGASAVGEVETPPPPGPDLVRWWVGKLQSVSPMAEVLLERWPKWTARDDLASYLGMSPTSGTFSTYLGRLSTPGLIQRDRDRGIRLSAEVMGQ